MVELLESRRLLSVTVINRVVHVDGTSGADRVTWLNINGQLKVEVNGVASQLINASDFDSIWIDVGGGDDVVYATNNSFPATILGGNGNDVLTGSFASDLLVGGKGNDELTGDAGDDTLVGATGNDRLIGGGGSDHLLGSAGVDRAVTDGTDAEIDCESRELSEAWAPLDADQYQNVVTDVRVKFVPGRGYVAAMDFDYGSTGFREFVLGVHRDGDTLRVTVSVDKWLGGSAAVLTHRLQTATLSHDLPKGSFLVIVQSPDGAIAGKQRFTVS